MAFSKKQTLAVRNLYYTKVHTPKVMLPKVMLSL